MQRFGHIGLEIDSCNADSSKQNIPTAAIITLQWNRVNFIFSQALPAL